jgi:hypothetical protein
VATVIAITVAVDVRNVCMSRSWKAEQVIFRFFIQTPVSFTHYLAPKPDQAPVYPVCLEPDQY